MKLTKVKSSNVVAIGYDGKNLIVQYKGGTYSYEGVERKVYDDLKKADSKGRFMNESVKGRYSYCKVC